METDFDVPNVAIDDVIILKGFGKNTKWRFPKYITNCPVLGCGLAFATRFDAINHYKDQHVDHFILCSICVKPISSKSLSQFKRHYTTIHPNERIPFDLDENGSSTDIQYSQNDEVRIYQ